MRDESPRIRPALAHAVTKAGGGKLRARVGMSQRRIPHRAFAPAKPGQRGTTVVRAMSEKRGGWDEAGSSRRVNALRRCDWEQRGSSTSWHIRAKQICTAQDCPSCRALRPSLVSSTSNPRSGSGARARALRRADGPIAVPVWGVYSTQTEYGYERRGRGERTCGEEADGAGEVIHQKWGSERAGMDAAAQSRCAVVQWRSVEVV
jgi:hypothetical protein